jgi:hypothetical protein
MSLNRTRERRAHPQETPTMMTMRDLPQRTFAPRGSGPARDVAGAVLRRAGLLLGGLVRRLPHREKAPAGDPVLEFYAEAGAPEGALYIDGDLVARLPGVSRL